MNMTLINYQEITDNQILYQMFGDEEYKIKAEQLQAALLTGIIYLNIQSKYLMLSNNPANGTLYTTVIKVEDNMRHTFDKIMNLLHSLGTIEWIKINKDRLDIKIKDSYELYLYDFTNGVI